MALEATEMQLEKLGSGENPSTVLAITAGVATDKVLKAEELAQKRGSGENLGDSLIEIAEKIVKSGGSLDLKITGPEGTARIEAGDE